MADDLRVVNFDDQTGIAFVAIGQQPKRLRGLPKLVQIVALEFLKNRGRDVFDPSAGSDLRAEVGAYNYSDDSEVRLLMVERASFVEERIISTQPLNAEPTEKLKKLQLLDAAFDSLTGQALLRVQIINEAGQSSDVLV